jgi:hypothetical protein
MSPFTSAEEVRKTFDAIVTFLSAAGRPPLPV